MPPDAGYFRIRGHYRVSDLNLGRIDQVSGLLEDLLAQRADGADPVSGHVLPGSAGSDAIVGITNSGIVFVATGANVLLHGLSPLSAGVNGIA